MANKKAKSATPNRSNPQSNKSLAIRMLLKKMPNAKAAEVAAAVKKEYGHEVSQNMIYMVKTKSNMAADRRESPITSAALWVDAIKTARQLWLRIAERAPLRPQRYGSMPSRPPVSC